MCMFDKEKMKPCKKKPFIVSFEGIEGCGKTTQFNKFIKFLKKVGNIKFLYFREPGSTSLGEYLRNILLHSRLPITTLAEALLFCASRVQLLKENLKDIYKSDIVIFDRFVDSTLAYQGSDPKLEIEFKQFSEIVEKFCLGIFPDLTFIFDIEVEKARLRKHDKDRFFKRDLTYHRRVRRKYRELAKIWPQRIVVIDASRQEEEVFDKVKNIFFERCPQKVKYCIQKSGII